jgi:hypothetical protein
MDDRNDSLIENGKPTWVESTGQEVEESLWRTGTAITFLAGYAPEDAIYDSVCLLGQNASKDRPCTR